MWKPYRRIEETRDRVVWRYSPLCSWWLYGTIAVLLVGIWQGSLVIEGIAIASACLYLLFVTLPGLGPARAIRSAMRNGSVTMHGSRWSFSDPLTFRVPKALAEEGEAA
ncbi:MAG: hypothetical protein V2J02_22450 [Pseudomonadales bacterium]|jgi:hypothetical protein|nr:hypothetical protein [Pseudomonadales bacterium]